MLQSTARQIFVAFVNTEIARKFNLYNYLIKRVLTV